MINIQSTKYLNTKKEITDMLAKSQSYIELSHAENTLYWLLHMHPKSDEITMLAAYAHDIERSTPDKLRKQDYIDYNLYKQLHSEKGGNIASKIASKNGYELMDCNRLNRLIREAEFSSSDVFVQRVCDADSISFFDNNIEHYTNNNSKIRLDHKKVFMYNRATPRARKIIDMIMEKKRIRLAE